MTLPKTSLILSSLLLVTACSTKEKIKAPDNNNTTLHHIGIVQTIDKNSTKPPKETNLDNEESTTPLSGDFAGNYKLIEFIDYMHNQYEFSYKELYQLFSQAKDTNQMIEPCRVRNNNGSCVVQLQKGKWDRYKAMFVYERNIQRGIDFWNEHEETLNRAYQTYGVPPEYIIGILGVETAYGVNFGKKRVIDVLTTKGMLGDRREDFYTDELEKFLIMTRKAGLNPSELMGSNAGAMGYGQFIASSYLRFAVDFNNDGVIDLWNPQDAIGSIANYFAQNGWKSSISQVAVRARYRGNRFNRLKTGYKTKYSQYKLKKKYHITPRSKLYYKGSVSLIKLHRATYDELWFGTHNFRVITTYNHSAFYAMAVHVLGQTVKERR